CWTTSWMSRVVRPLAYKARIFSSKPARRRWYLPMSWGWKVPARSRGMSRGMSPISPWMVFLEWPLRRVFVGAVAAGGRPQGQRRLNGLAGEVGGHLGVEHALQGRLHHAPEKGVEVVDGAGLGGHLAGQSFGLGSQFRVHASISVKGTGWAI